MVPLPGQSQRVRPRNKGGGVRLGQGQESGFPEDSFCSRLKSEPHQMGSAQAAGARRTHEPGFRPYPPWHRDRNMTEAPRLGTEFIPI